MLTRRDFMTRYPGVVLVAVSKTHPIDKIAALYDEGQRDFGENYAQELIKKAGEAKALGLDQIRWHFVGHLQSNKAREVARIASVVHSVDSEKLAHKLAEGAASVGKLVEVFVEVNLDAEPTKSGVAVDACAPLCKIVASMPGLSLLGLMALPKPNAGDITGTESTFRRLAALEATCRPATLGRLSMGTTDDFEAAIRAGATHVRIGRALFGERQRSD